LKIGIDARAAAEVKAGRGRVVRELLEGLAQLRDDHSFILYCRRPVTELRLDARFDWQPLALPDPLWHAGAALAANRSCDVFFSTNSYLTVWLTRVPSVLLVYDMVAFVPGARAQRRARMIERVTIRRALHRAHSAICISHATERDLLERFPKASGKTLVVHLAAGPHFARVRAEDELDAVRLRYGLDKPFVLSTGTLEPRKNLPRLIEAFVGLPSDVRSRFQLVLVGAQGWETQETLRSASLHADVVKVLGYVSEDDLAGLYQLCSVFCYPSLYEGFGLPLLEAMKAGAPSITSKISSLPEVGGDSAHYVDPLDVADIRRGLEELLESEEERRRLGERARRQAASFAWERTARAVLDRLVESSL
jgi:glycosyltransferase involved in cell wall biosynthesis